MNVDDRITKPATAVVVAAIATSEAVGKRSKSNRDTVLRRLRAALQPRIRALREAEHLNEEDFAIRINARG